MGNEYRVAKCEDTGKAALYCKVGATTWVLLAHEPDFLAIGLALTAFADKETE